MIRGLLAPGSETCGSVSTTTLCAGTGTDNLPRGLALNFDQDDTNNFVYTFMAPLTLFLILWQAGFWRLRIVIAAQEVLYKILPPFLQSRILWLVLEHIYITDLFGWAFAIEFTDFGGPFQRARDRYQ